MFHFTNLCLDRIDWDLIVEFDNKLPLTHIGKSRKQNPKIGCVTERHFRKQNPRKFRKICFGCVTERHFWKQNPDKNPE